ncbi:Protein arginine methyltransferase NDUFAF7-like protein, mitochondrial [Pseudozyma hubeiensis]|nr:Protein arginine methyltransferase NDUFAF7-like protein, mitochondrial [Pseudozyma hubeiensis]
MAVASSSRRIAVQHSRGLRIASTSSLAAQSAFPSKPRSLHASFDPRLSTITRPAQSFTVARHASSSSSPRRPQNDDTSKSNDEFSRHRSQYNYDPFTLHPEAKHYTYPLVTSSQLASPTFSRKTGPGGRPREVRMLARDFIHDSLYNPQYGYFTKQAVLLPDPPSSVEQSQRNGEVKEVAGEMYTEEMGILRPANPGFDFNSISNESEFMRKVEERYQLFEEQIEILVRERENLETQPEAKQEAKGKAAAEYSAAGLEAAQRRGRAMRAREGVQEADVQSMAAKQVWHTPTQIFQPYYAEAIARYLVAEYKLHNYPYDDLVVYELGAGSGALAKGVLDYLEQKEPEIYTRTRYRIVEISERLAMEQRRKLESHGEKAQVVNQDVLTWDRGVVQEPCFVIALEVFDNLAHDVVRYSTRDFTPYQAVVSIDDTGDMHELWEPLSDPLIKQYLSIISPSLSPTSTTSPFLRSLPPTLQRAIATHTPFYPNLTQPIFVPTNALQLISTLKRNFPQHRLIMSDFDSLPDSVPGINGPVVQTRFRSTMIPVTTYLVLQGFFDIFFPTNFDHLRKVYRNILNSSPQGFFDSHFSSGLTGSAATGTGRERNLKVLPHAEFLGRFAETEKLQLRDGSNPLLGWYANASWFLS